MDCTGFTDPALCISDNNIIAAANGNLVQKLSMFQGILASSYIASSVSS